MKRVLHATDFSAGADAALRFALEVAQRFDADLLVVHAAPSAGFRRSRDLEARIRDSVERVRAEVAHLRSATPPVSYHVIDQPGMAEGIADFANDEEVDVIVLGRYGGRPLRRLLMGSVATAVMHAARTDVLIVPEERKSGGDGPRENGGVLVPMDLRDRSVPLTTSAAEIARHFGARMELLHVLDLPERFQLPSGAFASNIGSLAEVARDRLRDVASDSRVRVNISTRVESGHPAEMILKVLDEGGFQLLVLASSGMGPDERIRHYPMERERYDELKWTVSRVTERIASYSPVPVWVVKRFPADLAQPAPATSVQDPTALDV